MFDAVVLIIALAFLDDVFRAESIKSVEDLFKKRVQAPRHSLHIKWKKSWLNKPIIRQAVPTSNGIQTSDDKPLTYNIYLKSLQRLSKLVGFPQLLTPYCLRRGSGEGVESKRPHQLIITNTDIYF